MTKNPFISDKFDVKASVEITPSLAQYILDYWNKRNPRSPNWGAIQTIVQTLKAGHWNPHTGNPIRFHRDGNVVDGQHRLHGIAESKVTVQTTVAFGLDDDAQKYIDNMRVRSAGIRFAAATRQGRENAGELGKRIKIAGVWMRAINALRDRWDDETKYEFYSSHQKDIEAVMANGLNRKTRGSGFRAAVAMYHSKRPENAQKFFELVTGDEPYLRKDSPVSKLREYFLNRVYGGNDSANQRDFNITAAAIHAYEQGRLIKTDMEYCPFKHWEF